MGKVIGVIPARYHSTRFEGKPLAKIGSKTMIEMVYERCLGAGSLSEILIATDDERIRKHVEEFGGKAVMTSADIETGTDRCYAVVKDLECDIVVNIQGDEPLIDPSVIDACVGGLESSPEAVCATAVRETTDESEIFSPNCVKAVMNRKGQAMYFSRLPIPGYRNIESEQNYFKHIGLYAYRRDFMDKYVSMERSPLELAESLEQLRMLENGYVIQCCPVEYDAIGVDTPQDLKRVNEILGLQ